MDTEAMEQEKLQITWKCAPDMPYSMTDYIQSVVVQGRLYIGGGYAHSDSSTDSLDANYLVMEYGISSGKWTTLPPYTAHEFAMAVVSNQLVLVGGEEQDGTHSKVLGVWGADHKAWTHPYPEMPTARSFCSVVAWNEWLVVVGGWGRGKQVPIEILHTGTHQWHSGRPTPLPWSRMKSAVVEGEWYFMGGTDNAQLATDKVYQVNIDSLISHVISPAPSRFIREKWKEISGLGHIWSAPLSLSKSLLAVGGRDKDSSKTVTALHLYQPESGKWVKVGDLPSPRYSCTCAVTGDREVLVAGGHDGSQLLKRLDSALITEFC